MMLSCLLLPVEKARRDGLELIRANWGQVGVWISSSSFSFSSSSCSSSASDDDDDFNLLLVISGLVVIPVLLFTKYSFPVCKQQTQKERRASPSQERRSYMRWDELTAKDMLWALACIMNGAVASSSSPSDWV
jgi:hypothetical protein